MIDFEIKPTIFPPDRILDRHQRETDGLRREFYMKRKDVVETALQKLPLERRNAANSPFRFLIPPEYREAVAFQINMEKNLDYLKTVKEFNIINTLYYVKKKFLYAKHAVEHFPDVFLYTNNPHMRLPKKKIAAKTTLLAEKLIEEARNAAKRI